MSDDSNWGREEPLGDGGDAAADAAGAPSEETTATADVAVGYGGGAPAGADSSADGGQPQTKLCVYCISEIDALATRCNRCSGYLPPAEGTDFKQHWTLLFCCVSILVACIWLPIEGTRNDIYASQSIAGGFLTVFAAYGIFASWANLFHRKMIVWPALFMAGDGIFVAVRRLIQMLKPLIDHRDTTTKEQWMRVAGPGLWVILFCSLLVLWTFISGAISGAKKDKERREAARAARKR
mgnify:CR=1 FL=1